MSAILEQNPHNYPNINPNSDLALEVSQHVNDRVKIVINYLDRDLTATEFEKREKMSMGTAKRTLSELLETVKAQKLWIEYSYLTQPHLPHARKGAAAMAIGNTFERFGFGTCIEMGAIGYAYCKKKNIPGELFLETFYNHAFLVIGRNRESKSDDYKNWGKEAVVCDPWAQLVYPANEIPERMKLYRETQDLEDGSIKTIFEPFSYRCRFSLIAESG